MRATFLATSLLASIAVAYFGEPYAIQNTDAILVLVTVFTVFAGFLVAIVTVLGDPGLIPPGSWRIAEVRREETENRLIRHVWLFVLYLIAIALLFAGVLLEKGPGVDAFAKSWITRAYLCVGSFSFLLTFALPFSLLALQRARIDAEIERRRKEAHIESDDDEQ